MKKRLISLLMVVCLIFSMLPTVSAVGTEEDDYPVLTLDSGVTVSIETANIRVYCTFTPEKTEGYAFNVDSATVSPEYEVLNANLELVEWDRWNGEGSPSWILQGGETYYIAIWSDNIGSADVTVEIVHSYSSQGDVTKEATCQTEGTMEYPCSFCDSKKETTYTVGHQYEYEVTKEATCQEDGEKTGTCIYGCGESYTFSYSVDHSYGEDDVCTVCGEHRYLRTGTCGENVTWSLNIETGVLTISGAGTMEDYDAGYDTPWYQYRGSVFAIEIGEGVTSIGNYAFYYFNYLTSVSIPSTVTSIGNLAFALCGMLAQVQLPDALTYIGSRAFYNTGLTEITIPGSVTSIGDSVFEYADLAKITLEEGVTSIPANMCNSCTSLEEVVLPEGLREIGVRAFWECSNLKKIQFPSSLNSIGSYAFAYCNGMEKVEIGASVTLIAERAFYRCENLASYSVAEANTAYCDVDGILYSEDMTKLIHAPMAKTLGSVTVPNGVVVIEDEAFYGCDTLTEVYLPDSLTSIGTYAFYSCDNLRNVRMPEKLTSLDDCAFAYCPLLRDISIPSGVTSVEEDAFLSNALVGITFHDSVTVCESAYGYEGGFITCSELQTISLPETVESIAFLYDVSFSDNLRFEGDPPTTGTIASGTTCYYPGNNAKWTEEVRESLGTDLTWIAISDECLAGEHTYSNYVSLDEGTCISEAAEYALCDKCAYLNIRTRTGEYGGHNYTSFVVTKQPTCKEQGVRTGYCSYCYGSYEEAAPIDYDAHYYVDDVCMICGKKDESIESGICGDNATWMLDTTTGVLTISGTGDMYDFYTYSSPDPDRYNDYAAYRSVAPWREWREWIRVCVIEDGITSIGDSAFSGLTYLSMVVIPDSVSRIGRFAFNYCGGLQTVKLPEGITVIEENTFRWCHILTEIDIPDTVTSIEAEAFKGCYKLAKIEFPETLENIGAYAFSGCDALTEIEIPDSVTKIEGSAFSNCMALTTVFMPKSFCVIAGQAFKGCYKIETVNFDGDAPGISNNAFHSVVANCYYPESNETWTDDILQNYGGTLTWIGYEYDCDTDGHAFGPWQTVREETSSQDGLRQRVCSVCGETEEETIHTYCKHTSTKLEGVEKVSCLKDGYTGDLVCVDCGETMEKGSVIAHSGHAWNSGEVTKEATTEEEGERTYTCETCAATKTEVIDKLPQEHIHSFGEWVVTKEATLSAEGEQERVCACGEKEVQAIAKLEQTHTHSFGEWVVTKEATLSEEGEQERVCACGEKEVQKIAKLEQEHTHSFGEWVVTKEATLSEEGKQERVCVCGEAETQAIEKLTFPFDDVDTTSYFYEPVAWAVDNGITTGTSAETFSPFSACKRSEVVTFLWRMAGEPEVENAENPFEDVADGAWYAEPVLWAVQEGITTGTTASTFSPDATCTRAQVVTFLYRYAGEPEVEEVDNPFGDVVEGDYFYAPVMWAVDNGITTGTTTTTFTPYPAEETDKVDPGECERCQIVTFLYRSQK